MEVIQEDKVVNAHYDKKKLKHFKITFKSKN